MPNNLATGFKYFITGCSLITQPGLRLFVIVPLVINILVFAVLITATINQMGTWINTAINWLPEFLSFLRWVLWPMAFVLIASVVMYSFSMIANLIASPFNGLLAEKTQELITGEPVPGFETFAKPCSHSPQALNAN